MGAVREGCRYGDAVASEAAQGKIKEAGGSFPEPQALACVTAIWERFMAVKPNGDICRIREQIIEDRVTGLTLQFVSMPGSDAPVRLRIFGNLPLGNREILFDHLGNEAGSGTALTGRCRASWLTDVSS
jgi:hypothetical protein